MALERILPRFDVNERHSTVVRADAARAYAALREVDLADSWLAVVLFRIRHLAGLIGGASPQRPPHLRLDDFLRAGFVLLADEADAEIVIGVAGRFWRTSGGRLPVTPEAFASFTVPGTAKAATNFRVQPIGPGRTRVSTETRVLCADGSARWRFLLYWTLVGLGSALIRLELLRLIKRSAEREERATRLS